MTLELARKRKRLTQARLAELSGVAQSTISDLENGKLQAPTWETVARLAQTLGVRPETLFPVEPKAVAS